MNAIRTILFPTDLSGKSGEVFEVGMFHRPRPWSAADRPSCCARAAITRPR